MIMGTSRRRIVDLYGFPPSPNTKSMSGDIPTTPTISATKFFPPDTMAAASEAAASATAYNANADENSRRAGCVSVTFRKKAAHTRLGLKVESDENGKLVVGEMNDIGALHRSVLREGDEFFSVNGKKCDGMSEMELVDMLREATGQITITVRNRSGVRKLVECMVEKIDRNELGITFNNAKSPNEAESEQLMISHVDSKGIFGESLLSSGDRIVSVNGKEYKKGDGEAAMDSMRKSLRFVTILAEVMNITSLPTNGVRLSSSPGGTTELSLRSPTSTDETTGVTLEKKE